MDYHGTDKDDVIDQTALGVPDWTPIYGEGGNDSIRFGALNAIGGAGNDTLIGTAAQSTAAYWGSPKGVVLDLRAGTVEDGFGTVDTLVNIRSVHGSGNADTLLGSDGNDAFYTSSGDDFVDGRDGEDKVQFLFSPSTKFSIAYNEAEKTFTVGNTDPNDGNYGTKTLKNIEVIEFTGAGADGVKVSVSSLLPSGFRITRGTPFDNADAGGNPRWTVTDLDGDGRQDVVLRFDPEAAFSTTVIGYSPVRFFLQQADGSYKLADGAMSANVAPTLVNRIKSADFNGDGKGDVVIGASGQDPYLDGKPYGPWPGEVSYVLMSGQAAHTNVAVAGMPQLFSHSVAVGDIDGDNRPDIFIDSINQSPQAASYFLVNDGKGGFGFDRTRLPESLRNPAPVVTSTFSNGAPKTLEQNTYTGCILFDANGDGALDLGMLPMGATYRGKVFLNDGKGFFSDSRKIDLPAGPYGHGSQYWESPGTTESTSGSIYLDAVALDVNADGRQDLVSVVTKDKRNDASYEYYAGAAVQVLINTGSGFADASSTHTDFVHTPGINYSHYDSIEAVDINADGFKDIVVYRAQSMSNADLAAATRFLVNDGRGFFKETQYPAGLQDGQLVAVDPASGKYVMFAATNFGRNPATGFSDYKVRVDSVEFDWSQGRDFFTGELRASQDMLASDLPGRWIHGTNNGNAITLSTGEERAYGYGGDDSIRGGAGNDVINGGDGTDTALYAGARASFSIARNGQGITVTDKTGGEGTDTLAGIERLHFSDVTVDLQIGSAARSIAAADLKMLEELYVAFFNRVPDAEGLGYWIAQFRNGQSMASIADNFYQAAVQFSTLTGYSSTMSNADFVKVIYKNVLGRSGTSAPPDEDVAYWAGELADGRASKGSLIATMLNSAHSFKGNATWGWVADLLDNKLAVANYYAVEQGLTCIDPGEAITRGMAIAAAVTPDDTSAAIALVGVADGALSGV
ncbi:FG-GAP-like repeat-containing protein [Noviherbaspirillum sp.]|uniref:FG-GAP-like repeat-containing protein n=1 Tax=Noviherbaspirillum sp. TaxID=1926288 RepID=UPI002D2C92F2|nr:FG-GAP-like repeat-containing protein [Noviherbaspirillum sp.]HZW22833.1 FG-GAP-like repeat-containing protein [Noviherbaspirillum sp.]